jgi:hypothetical protein
MGSCWNNDSRFAEVPQGLEARLNRELIAALENAAPPKIKVCGAGRRNLDPSLRSGRQSVLVREDEPCAFGKTIRVRSGRKP